MFLSYDSHDKKTALAYSLSALGVVAGSVYVYRRRHPSQKPWKLIPGWLPIVGHAHHIQSVPTITDNLEEWADKYGQEDGCYEVDMAGQRYVVICRADLAEDVLKQRPKSVTRSLPVIEAANSINGNGVFAAEGEQWRAEHRIVAAALNHANVGDYLTSQKVMVERLVAKWIRQSDAPVIIDSDLALMASDSIAKAAMGRDYDFLNHPDSQVAKDVKSSMHALVKRGIAPVFYWKLPLIGQYLDGYGWGIARIRKLIDSVIEDHEQHPSKANNTFLSKVYDQMKATRAPLPRDRMIGNVGTLFLAGTDTTSRTLTMCLYQLAQDDKLQQELRDEVDPLDLDTVTLDDLYVCMPRVKSFLHEIHRLYSVPFIGLETTANIPFGLSTMPAKTNVFVLTRYINAQPSHDVPAGPENQPANVFSPRRWLVKDANGKVASVTPKRGMSFLGFGHGVRICPGRTYSEALSYLALPSILQTFVFELTPGHPHPKIVLDTTMVPDCQVQLALKRRIQ